MPETILLVDDDVDTLRLVGIMLQRQGYQILAANSGEEALIKAQDESPDLILLDIMMPDIDGFQVTKKLRENPRTSTIPIIMFTAKNHIDDKVTGFEAGADDYLTKPTQPRELYAHINSILSRENKISSIPTLISRQSGRGYVIGILAAKGGCGVSTMALNLGICLQNLNKRETTIAEFRPGEGDIALMLGITNPNGLTNLLGMSIREINPASISSQLINHKHNVKLLLSSSVPTDTNHIYNQDHFESIARHLAHLSDIIVFDLGPSLLPPAQKILPICDELILLVESNPINVLRSQILIDELREMGYGEGRLHTVLYNKQRIDTQYSLSQVQQDLRYPISIVFTTASELNLQATNNRVPLVIFNPDNITSQQFFRLAENITKRLQVRQ